MRDQNKGISSISYNLLNLPQTITKNDGSTVVYVYSASGNKLRKLYTAGGTTTTTEYDNGIQYDNNATNVAFIQTEEGRARKSGSNYVYEYDLKDHLGNTRVTLTPDPNDATQQTAKLLQQNDYYAFGYGIQSTQQIIFPKNEYLYNHKELQEETGLYDYGARFYDPVIGRWTSVDPLSELDRRLSPYIYGFDDPMRFTDPDGMWPDWLDHAIASAKQWLGAPASPTTQQATQASMAGAFGASTAPPPTNGEALLQTIGAASVHMSASVPGSLKIPATVHAPETPEVASVGTRATQIHAEAKPATQGRTTIAVADATDANGNKVRIVGSNEPTLRREQRAALQPGEVEAKGPGHAEVTVINHANDNGLTIQSIGASRPICPSCATNINSLGITPATPLKKPIPFIQ